MLYVRVKPSHEVERIVNKPARKPARQIWGRIQDNSAALKVPKSTVAAIILKW